MLGLIVVLLIYYALTGPPTGRNRQRLPLMAHNGPAEHPERCPLLEEKRKSPSRRATSHFDPERTRITRFFANVSFGASGFTDKMPAPMGGGREFVWGLAGCGR
jgi:hypothetical protein